jgi:hypothetical protein
MNAAYTSVPYLATLLVVSLFVSTKRVVQVAAPCRSRRRRLLLGLLGLPECCLPRCELVETRAKRIKGRYVILSAAAAANAGACSSASSSCSGRAGLPTSIGCSRGSGLRKRKQRGGTSAKTTDRQARNQGSEAARTEAGSK